MGRYFATVVVLVAVFAGTAADAGSLARQWQVAAPVPLARTEVAGAVYRGELVVIGGFLANGQSTGRVDAYSPVRNRWRRLPSLPARVNHAMAAALGGRLFVVGGYGAEQRAFVFDGRRWRSLRPPPEPRAAGGAAIVGGKLYVVGGVERPDRRLPDRMLVYDLRRQRWSTAPGPIRREHLAVVSLGGRVYALAGREAGFNFDYLEVYTPARRRWARLPSVPEPRGGTAAAAVGNSIVSVGGEETRAGGRTFRAVFAYDVRARRWSRLPDMRTPRHGLAALSYRGRVYAIAGGPRPGLFVSGANEYLQVR